MGEAKRRKASDPTFLGWRKGGRGIVITPSVKFDDEGNELGWNGTIDDALLRRCVLFFDKIVYPASRNLMFGHDPSVGYLMGLGLVRRPTFSLAGTGGSMEDHLARMHLGVFEQLESHEPGVWCMSEGADRFLAGIPAAEQSRGIVTKLVGAIPIPSREVPLDDLLAFKAKRLDEVKALTGAIDDFYLKVTAASDQHFAFQWALREIDRTCEDMVKVARETRFPWRLSTSSFNFNPSLASGLDLLGLVEALGSGTFELPRMTSLLGATTLGVSVGPGLQIHKRNRQPDSAHPFRFVATLHREAI